MSWIQKVESESEGLQKIIILLANANNESIKGKTKLQKMLFLLSESLPEIKNESSFEADNFGPYSQIVEEETDYLQDIGVFNIDDFDIGLTNEGKIIANNLKANMNKDILDLLCDFKKFVNDMDNKELLYYVYASHPEMTVESTVYDDLEKDKEKYILSLLKKQKISSLRASELLNKPYSFIIQKMKDKNILLLS